ncbi:MAG TPA: hypothetical protein VFZ17_05940 [Acidimicrobiia bacterium]|nr:hypothetical protein [Acidimicrobiia bacterium]
MDSMDDRKWERWASLGGILFAVATALSAGLPGSPPKTSDSATKISDFIADKGDELRWGAFLAGLATLGLLWWLGSVYRTLRRGEGGSPRLAIVAVGAAVFAAAVSTIGSVMLGSLPIIGVRTLSPQGARLFYIISSNVTVATVFGMAVFVAAFSVVIIRSHVLPVWLGWVGVLIAVVAVFGGGVVASTRDVFFYGSFGAFVAFLLWVLVVSGLMLAGRGEDSDAGAAAPTPAASAS